MAPPEKTTVVVLMLTAPETVAVETDADVVVEADITVVIADDFCCQVFSSDFS